MTVTTKHLCLLIMALGFMPHLAACCSGALKVVSSMGESRKLSYRNRWIRQPIGRENGAGARAFL